MDCIFCKIVEGELPAYKIYEDKRILAFLDINPVKKGHLLVIVKEHYENIIDLPKDLLKELISRVQDLAEGVMMGAGSRAFNIVLNNGREAGQLVNHIHFHIIPRNEGDNLHPWSGKAYTEEEMQRTANNIRKSL